jgi:hypothetical protein
MTSPVTLLVVCALLAVVEAQGSINAHDGFNVGMHAAVSLTICFSLILGFTLIVNFIHSKLVKKLPGRDGDE